MNTVQTELEIRCVELPGHGERYGEPSCDHIKPLVDQIVDEIAPTFDRPYAFFGHSMGALLSFELTHRIGFLGLAQPSYLFLSAARAPHLPRPNRDWQGLSECEFIEGVKNLNGTPPEFWEYPELMEMWLPVIRRDFAVLGAYEYKPRCPLDCPIAVFGGKDDDITLEELSAWRIHTHASFGLHLFPGDHFFIKRRENAVLELVAGALQVGKSERNDPNR